MNIDDILKITFILTAYATGIVGTFGERGNSYRVCLTVTLASLCGIGLFEEGLMGLGLVLIYSLVLHPVVLMLISRLMFRQMWLPIRAKFPGEPRNPPVTHLTFTGAIRFIWGN
ncbi:hypothetical protein [Methylomonas methanica]|uniref:Uncharacterized protein n=1 Tax=Methylomonas methanica TaxID=421 RepID=A0A177MYQ2_METMH|nr:hypothetical protein [Methylomonas methanica]OAI10827.1 hypothetical protein A1332_23600 [Methylomonas methanica]